MGFKIGITEKRKEILKKELNRIIDEIIKLNVEKIILFGSLCSNSIHKSSDIDLIVVQKNKKKFLDRIEEFYEYLKPNVAVDIFVYTPEEFNKMKDKNQFIRLATKKGKIIYEKK